MATHTPHFHPRKLVAGLLALLTLAGCQSAANTADDPPPRPRPKITRQQPIPETAREILLTTEDASRQTPDAALNVVLTALQAGEPLAYADGEAPHPADFMQVPVGERVYLLENIPYKDYAILGVEFRPKKGKAVRRHYPFKETWQGWYLTRDLDEDPFFRELQRLDREYNKLG